MAAVFLRREGFFVGDGKAKSLLQVLSAKEHHWVGNGFYVSTIFSVFDVDYKMITPFVLMDHADTKHFPPTTEKLGVGEHPHRGFETVTFAIQGEVEHRDSGGGGGVITTGGVQWMTAASGVVHDEFHSREFAQTGGDFSMVQLWVNLPAKDKMTKPRYQSLDFKSFQQVEMAEGRAAASLIAGELAGHTGPAKTHTPMNIYRLKAIEDVELPLDLHEGFTSLLFVLEGSMKIQDQTLKARDLAAMSREGKICQVKLSKGSEILVLNGEPIDEPIVHYGPFVMNTKAEIQQAILDFQAGKMGSLVEESGS
ncbi:MAG: pirin family protein [Pseudomonadota bacterium]